MITTSMRAWHIAALLVAGIFFTFRTVYAADVVFGQIASTTHPASKANAESLTVGIQAYFSLINAKGGINGKQLKLKLLDDGLDKKRMIELTDTLIADPSVLGLIGYLNTPGLLALAEQKTFARNGIALVAPLQGDRSVVSAENVFPLRSGYADEIDALLKELKRWDKDRIAIVNMASSFGPTMGEIANQRANEAGLKVTTRALVDAANPATIQAAVRDVNAARPKGILLIASGTPAFDFIKALKDSPSGQTPVYGPSVLLHVELVKAFGTAKSTGIVLSQATPYPFVPYQVVTTEYQAAMKAYAPDAPVSFSSFEGYLGAKIAVEAVRRAGNEPSRAKVLAALRNLGEFDLGGYSVKYTPAMRRGWGGVDLTLINSRGNLAR